MDDLQQRLESIRLVVNAFKIEQEALIFKSGESSISSPARRYSNAKTMQPIVKSANCTDSINIAANNKGQLAQTLNIDAIVMPVSTLFVLDQRLWPQALQAKQSDCSVMLANIESHGTLWKLITRPDGYAGHRVYLQSAVSVRVCSFQSLTYSRTYRKSGRNQSTLVVTSNLSTRKVSNLHILILTSI
jgi:hypothetical protein